MRNLRMPPVLIIVLVLVLTACGAASQSGSPAASGGSGESPGTPTAAGGEPRDGGTLTLGIQAGPSTLDLPNFVGIVEMTVTAPMVFETLIRRNFDTGEFEPLLAESWEQPDDVTYRFFLRQGISFTDGTPFNADAVIAYFTRAKGALRGDRFFSALDTVEAEDEYTVVFHLSQPFVSFLGNLSYGVSGIASPASIEGVAPDDRETLRDVAIGTGPFTVANFVPNESIELVKNPDYWGTPAHLDRIVFQSFLEPSTRLAALEAGEIDIIIATPAHRIADLQGNEQFTVLVQPFAQTFFWSFNHSNPILADARVREAIMLGIDRTAIIEGVTEGLMRLPNSFAPPEILETETVIPERDVDRARELLADAGYASGLELELMTARGTYFADLEIAEAIQAQLDEIGITLTLSPLEHAAQNDALARHEQEVWDIGWAHTLDPHAWYFANFACDSAANFAAYCNPEIDDLINSAPAASSLDEAHEIWRQLDQALIDDFAAMPLYWTTDLLTYNNRVHDPGFSPLGNYDFSATWVDQ